MREIPHIIHYCWFGRGEKPENILKYIDGWKKFLPDYIFVEWNEDNFDIDKAPEYVKEAYSVRKFAFVSDYARVRALYEQGGVYLDTDIEILKRFDEYLTDHEMVLCFESDKSLSTAFIACCKGNELIDGFSKTYEERKFLNADGSYDMTPINDKFTEYLEKNVSLDSADESLRTINDEKIIIYPREYFSGFDISNWHEKTTEKTCCIHHMNSSWSSGKKKVYFGIIHFLQKVLGYKGYDRLKGFYDHIRGKKVV